MQDHTVGVATEADRDKAIATLELAFSADPVMRWFWPDPAVYRATFARFVGAIAGSAFDEGSAFWLTVVRAVALWLPPGFASDDDALTEVLLESVRPELLEDLAAFADLVREFHPVVEHWYLPVMGVDPFVQGRGHGSALLRHALAACDRDGLPAYLESFDDEEPPALRAVRVQGPRRAPGRDFAVGVGDASRPGPRDLTGWPASGSDDAHPEPTAPRPSVQ